MKNHLVGRTSRAAVVLVVLVVLSGAGCVSNVTGPVRTPTTYEHKAAATASTAISAVATVWLTTDAADRQKVFGTYASVVVSNAEGELQAATGTFESIRPPDEGSLAVREELIGILAEATDAVSAARIVIRGPGTDLGPVLDDLTAVLDELRAFEEQYQ